MSQAIRFISTPFQYQTPQFILVNYSSPTTGVIIEPASISRLDNKRLAPSTKHQHYKTIRVVPKSSTDNNRKNMYTISTPPIRRFDHNRDGYENIHNSDSAGQHSFLQRDGW
jgi:hypothetical protein